MQSGNQIADEKPENRPEIEERLEKLNVKWQELADASKQKGTKLEDAKKQEEFNTGVQNIQQWFTEIETTAVTHEKASDLTTATRIYQKHKVTSRKAKGQFFTRFFGLKMASHEIYNSFHLCGLVKLLIPSRVKSQNHLVQHNKQYHRKVLLLSFEWSYLRILSTDSKVRTTLYSIINSTTGKYCSVAFI